MEKIDELDKSDILKIIESAANFKCDNNRSDNLKGYIFGLLFFEPSTRTSMSFESAIYRLGGNVIKYNSQYSSEKKGESLEDTIRTSDSYIDVFIIRHPEKNIISKIKKVTNKPIINAGDGDGEHPTQAMLDLFTIMEYYPKLPDKIAFTGDLKYSRTVNSLVSLLKKISSSFNKNIEYYFVSDKLLTPSINILRGINYKVISDSSIKEVIDIIDVLYVTRLQKERYFDENVQINIETIDSKLISSCKNNLIIMHPLPRNQELSTDLDNNEKSKYFEQVENGVFVRMAILNHVIKQFV